MVELTRRDMLDCASAYLETAFRSLENGDLGIAQAALRRCALYLLMLNDEEDENATQPTEER